MPTARGAVLRSPRDKVTSDTDLDGQFDETDFALATSQSLNIEAQSNRLLGLTQTVTRTNAGRTRSVVTTPVAYRLDANGSMTSDGLRDFEYDASGRLARVRVFKDGEAAQVKYLHNALGQRVLKSEPQAEQTLPSEQELGTDFITWLRRQFGWMFTQAQANTSIGTAYVFGDGQIPPWALLGEYDNGSSTGAGRTEYLWLPTEDGNAIPIGMYRGGRFFAIHSDHLGTPRLITNEQNKPVWQWPYSAFGNNKPTGILKATPDPRAAITNQPVLLKATGATEMNLRFPGQYFDQEAGTKYNYFRDYDAGQGRYRQFDPIGLAGGANGFAYSYASALNATDPYGLRVLLVAHTAAAPLGKITTPPSYHAALYLEPDDSCRCSGSWPMTLGGQKIGGTLLGVVNFPGDALSNAQFTQAVPTPAGMTDCEFIRALISAAATYKNDVEYSFPNLASGSMSPGRHNSNSFVAGVLRAVGATPPSLNSQGNFQLPGYSNPISLPNQK